MVRWLGFEGNHRRSLACVGGSVRRVVGEEARFNQTKPADSEREPPMLEVAVRERFAHRDEPRSHASKTGRCG